MIGGSEGGEPTSQARALVLMGTSRGGEGALLIASTLPHLLDGVVANSPSSIAMEALGPGAVMAAPAWSYGGRPVPLGTDVGAARITVPLLTSYGGDDQVWGSDDAVSIVMGELNNAHDPAPHTALGYPHAGHSAAGAAPCYPYPDYVRPTGGPLLHLGGSTSANAQAAEQFWARLLTFLDGIH